MTVDRSALFRIERSWNDHALAQRLAPADEDPPDLEWLGEQPELRVDKAQGAMDRGALWRYLDAPKAGHRPGGSIQDA